MNEHHGGDATLVSLRHSRIVVARQTRMAGLSGPTPAKASHRLPSLVPGHSFVLSRPLLNKH